WSPDSNHYTPYIGRGNGQFDPGSPYSGNFDHNQTGNYNGDGCQDILQIVNNSTAMQTLDLCNLSHPPVSFPFYFYETGYYTAVGDFNGDGITDIMLDDYVQIGQDVFNLYLSTGTGTTVTHPATLPVLHGDPFVTGDFNGYGKTDIEF